jgi:hypothetical protein
MMTMRSTTKVLGAVGVLAAIAAIAGAGCTSQSEDGSCQVSVNVLGTDVWTDSYYCGSHAQCDAFCAANANKGAYGACQWSSGFVCLDGDLPTAPPQVCALWQSIVCGGGPDDFQKFCDVSCTTDPNASDYDPSTDCLTKYKGPLVMGPDCGSAEAQL